MFVSRIVRSARAVFCINCICTLLFAILVPRIARSQSLQQQELEQTGLAQREVKTWDIFLGAAVASTNTYEGANSSRVRAAPFFLISYRDELFIGPLGLQWKAIDWNGLRAGPVLGLLGGRRQNLDPRLDGLGDIPSSLAAGLFVNYHLGHLQLNATFRQAVTHADNGWLGLVQLDYRTALITRRLGFFIGPEVEFADRQYNQTFFGVTPTQSSDSGLLIFTPPGGTKDFGLHAGLTYACTQHVIIRVFADEKWLGSDIKDSPIVERTTETLVGIGAAYHF
jgi:outer membrane protein